MEKSLDFRFEIPRTPDGLLIEFSAGEMEKYLLKNLAEAGTDSTKELWQLAQFYKLSNQHDKALQRLRELLQRLPDPEDKAECVFTMGQTMEQVGDYRAAVRYYKEAFALEPAHTFTWYFIHNNLGFSLNSLGDFTEGELYCRKAIEIDPERPNAHKNLGIALTSQGRHRQAAHAFVAATQANAADNRAFGLLKALLKQHSDLADEFQEMLVLCERAVEAAAQKIEVAKPVVHRGWRKHLILVWLKLRSILRPRR